MKKYLFFVLVLALSSCGSIKVVEIGKVNMISNRNVNPGATYQSISTYSGGSERELKKTRAKSIEDAVDQTVKKVPGGEFLTNAKLYLVYKSGEKYFAVEGDVWGNQENQSFRGFKIGDKVTWKSLSLSTGVTYKTGVLSAFKDSEKGMIKVDNEENKVIDLKYDDITKINN